MLLEQQNTYHIYDSAFCNGESIAYIILAESQEEAQELYIDLIEDHGDVTGNLRIVCH